MPDIVWQPGDAEPREVVRARSVGASESAHLLGLMGVFNLTNRQLAAKKREEWRGNQHTEAGVFWERPILDWARTITGHTITPEKATFAASGKPYLTASPDSYLQHHPGNQERSNALVAPWFHLFTADGWMLDGAEGLRELTSLLSHGPCLLEVKNQPSKKRSRWTKAIKETIPYYHCQAQHQMLVMEYELNILCAKVDHNEMYAHVIPADAQMQREIDSACEEFHRRYLQGGS